MDEADKRLVIVLAVINSELTISEAARRFNVSRDSIHRWISRYKASGPAGLTDRSRAPHHSPSRTPDDTRTQILRLRTELTTAGLDAGAESIHDRLTRAGITPPSTATIWRILRAAGTITPQPHKRPRSSWRTFEASAPNGCWQSDMTHWHLADGTDIEIITWLDDHSRKLLHISAHPTVTGPTVVNTFLAASRIHDLPASTLTDNGMIFTTRFARGGAGPNRFEHLLAQHGITQINGSPGHPQTQGKIERFHQTLKRWLNAHPDADTLEALNALLAVFAHIYNHERPHRALGRRTPNEAYTALPKATPTIELLERHWRVRHDIVNPAGTITLRWAGKLRHLAVGRTHTGTPIILLVAGPDTLVINPTTGEIIAEHQLDDTRDYHPKKRQKAPPEGGA